MNILYTNFHPGNGGGHTTYLNYLFNGVLPLGINAFIAVPKVSKLNKDLKQNYPSKVFDIDFPGKPKEFVNIIRKVSGMKNIFLDRRWENLHHRQIMQNLKNWMMVVYITISSEETLCE